MEITYSVIGILAIIIHCTINRSIIPIGKKGNNVTDNRKCYNRFLWGILIYYITDVLWGILHDMRCITLLKVDTFIYYIAMAVAVVFWCDYVVEYLHQGNYFGKILKYFGRIFVAFEIVALVTNFYNKLFFWFDANGDYYAGIIRYIALYIQIAMFLLAAVQALVVTFRTEGVRRRRHLAISIFGISMIIAIVAQIFYPILPIYSIGYLIGGCFLHIFVEEDEKDEYIENIKRQMEITKSVSGIYFCSYYVDMTNKTYVEIDNKIPENNGFIEKNGDAIETLDKMCNYLVRPQYAKEMREFTNLFTLDERLKEKKYYISIQFESVHLGWAEGYFIASDRDENGKLKHVIWAIRTINDEKQKEEKLLYNSYVDELTGLYNRKMYSEDITENIYKFMKDDLVYISMDVNGLKVINDSKGHAAGDELIRTAANCMKKAMGDYGRIYRTGGDEFIAMLNVDAKELQFIREKFEYLTSSYQSENIDSISISCGYVIKSEEPDITIKEIEKLADKKMYIAKQAFYASKGIDRRGHQQNAYKALCALYSKILMINLTENRYSIISMNKDEQIADKSFSNGIFEWMENFAKSGQVHPDDQALFISKTKKEFLREYFKNGNTSLSILYRRNVGGEFIPAEMMIIPSENYSDDNQNMYLFVSART